MCTFAIAAEEAADRRVCSISFASVALLARGVVPRVVCALLEVALCGCDLGRTVPAGPGGALFARIMRWLLVNAPMRSPVCVSLSDSCFVLLYTQVYEHRKMPLSERAPLRT